MLCIGSIVRSSEDRMKLVRWCIVCCWTMAYIIRMPKLGLEMDEGTLLGWRVEEGEEVAEGAILAEVESEKSVGEVEAREAGVLRERYLEAGESVEPSVPIGILAAPNEDIADVRATIEGADGGTTEFGDDASDAGESRSQSQPLSQSQTQARADSTSARTETSETQSDIKASPRAKQRAEDLGVDITTVEGTGPQGSIVADDIEAASEEAQAGGESREETSRRTFAAPSVRQLARELGVDIDSVSSDKTRVTESDVRAAATAVDTNTAMTGVGAATETAAETETTPVDRTLREEKPFDGMRRTIADRLSRSYREAVHVTEHREIDAEALLEAVEAADEAFETDISMPDVLLCAVSATLSDHPEFNGTFEDDVHRLYEEHNICVAVDIDAGLIAPVLRTVDTKQLPEIATDRRALTERALSGEYSMDDLQGGTFTVTNLGVLGVESFDPIINPPQVAILGVNAIQQRAVPADEGVAFRRHLPLDLSFDHRVVDGADAARFLETLAGHIENPWPLLL